VAVLGWRHRERFAPLPVPIARKLVSSGSPYEPKVGISRAVRAVAIVTVAGQRTRPCTFRRAESRSGSGRAEGTSLCVSCGPSRGQIPYGPTVDSRRVILRTRRSITLGPQFARKRPRCFLPTGCTSLSCQAVQLILQRRCKVCDFSAG